MPPLVARPLRPYPPPPSSLMAIFFFTLKIAENGVWQLFFPPTIFGLNVLYKYQLLSIWNKNFFFSLMARPLTFPPLLVALPQGEELFLRLPLLSI